MRLACSILLLVGLCVGQSSKDSVLAHNPTDFSRAQVIVFGIPKGKAPKGARILMKLPTVDICTARVIIPARHNGYVNVIFPALPGPQPKLGFSFSKTLTWSLSDSESKTVFRELVPIASNEQMVVRHYQAKDAQGMVGHLIVYQGAGEDWCRYEFVMALESLTLPSKAVRAGLRVTSPQGAIIVADRLLGVSPRWRGFSGTIRDRQGFTSFGSVIAPPTAQDKEWTISTKLAELHWEVTSCGRFDTWGHWNTPPRGQHTDRKFMHGLLGHRGMLLNKRPGDTGEQFGFGVIKHLDGIRPGQLLQLAYDRFAILQAACRPMWLFDADGSMPQIQNHPKFVSWDETWHWRQSTSPDRFGRTYDHPGWYTGWTGMDNQHYSVVALSEDVMLRGGFMSQLILKMKGFHWLKQANYPTSGRALGRFMFAARDYWVATGDPRYLKAVRERWLPAFTKNWAATNGHWVRWADFASKAPVALRLYKDDPHTKIPGLEWVCWEDGISIQALDVLWPMLNDPELKMATFLLARSIVNHGFDKKGRILKAIKWNGTRQAVGPQLANSEETNYTEWAIPTLAICARMAREFGDKKTAQKALLLLKPLLTSSYRNLDSYLAPVEGR